MAQNVDYTALQDLNLVALREKYPACVLPEVMALGKEGLGEEQRRELAVAINVRVGDPDTLVSLLGADMAGPPFYPDPRTAAHSTDETIDAFIGKFSAQDPRKEVEALEQLIFRPTGDYAATMLAGEGKGGNAASEPPAPETMPETNRELPKPHGETPREPHHETVGAAPGLSEGFARIMIKNHNYSKALEIIQAISLNNSEKSAYFADQIRFLRKLILNQSKQKRQKLIKKTLKT